MENHSSLSRDIVQSLIPDLVITDAMTEEDLRQILRTIIERERPHRMKIAAYNTFADAVELLRDSSRILVLTGAGVSTSCGIPDFRSKDGIYARLHVDYPNLPDPSAMFDLSYFKGNPRPFFEFARELFPGQFKPSVCHYFIKMLEDQGKLLRNYAQNIDTLEQVAGISRVVQCHGSFAKATCQNCRVKVDGNDLREDVFAGRVAMCKACQDPQGILKPDIVFFGEELPDEFHEKIAEDRSLVDLVVVIGSSLRVQPVSLIPFSVDPDVPQILINREPLPDYTADIELLGNCDDIITQIAHALGPPFTALHDIESLRGESGGAEDRVVFVPPVMREITETEFKNWIDEPEEKRLRSELGGLPVTCDERYLSVESKLPPNSYLFVNTNQSVFPGAEIYYDRQNDVFLQLRQSSGIAISGSNRSSSSSESSDANSSAITHSTSLPAFLESTWQPVRQSLSLPSVTSASDD